MQKNVTAASALNQLTAIAADCKASKAEHAYLDECLEKIREAVEFQEQYRDIIFSAQDIPSSTPSPETVLVGSPFALQGEMPPVPPAIVRQEGPEKRRTPAKALREVKHDA